MTSAHELADAHWHYIRSLLIAHGEPEWVVELIGFHYRSAFVHGHKHATEEKQ